MVDLSNNARERFLKDFGEKSNWYRKASVNDREKVKPFLKLNVHHFAIFYHSEAQKTNRTLDYGKAIFWYKKFLKSYPKEVESSRVNFLLAEGLFETKKYSEAVVEYKKTAYQYPLHRDSSEAGYAAVLAQEKVWIRLGKDVKDPQSRKTAIELAASCDLRVSPRTNVRWMCSSRVLRFIIKSETSKTPVAWPRKSLLVLARKGIPQFIRPSYW